MPCRRGVRCGVGIGSMADEEVAPQGEDDWKAAFGQPKDINSAVAVDRFGFVPTTFLDLTNADRWQLMTPDIKELMGKVEIKRGYAKTGTPDDEEGKRFVATQFNSGLCRLLVQYYTVPGDMVLDPFAGFGTRAYVCMLLGRRYMGFDVAQHTVDAVNKALDGVRQRALDNQQPSSAVVYFADGIKLEGIPDGTADAILTCPPYANREIYEDVDKEVGYQLSRLSLGYFEMFMKRGFKRWYTVLKPGGLAVFVVGDWREEGELYPFAANMVAWAREAGFTVHDSAVHRLRGTMALNVGTFMKSKFLPRSHESVLVFKRPGEKT